MRSILLPTHENSGQIISPKQSLPERFDTKPGYPEDERSRRESEHPCERSRNAGSRVADTRGKQDELAGGSTAHLLPPWPHSLLAPPQHNTLIAPVPKIRG